MDKKVARPT